MAALFCYQFFSTFSENYSLRGGTVFSAYTAVAFNDSNSFIRNQGVALNVSSYISVKVII